MAREVRELSKRQKNALAALSVAVFAVSLAASAFSGWLLVLVFPLVYAAILVRTW